MTDWPVFLISKALYFFDTLRYEMRSKSAFALLKFPHGRQFELYLCSDTISAGKILRDIACTRRFLCLPSRFDFHDFRHFSVRAAINGNAAS